MNLCALCGQKRQNEFKLDLANRFTTEDTEKHRGYRAWISVNLRALCGKSPARSRVVKAQVEFVADDDGVVEKGIHTQGGSSFDAAKIDLPDAIELSTEKLDEYVGSYSFGFLAGNMVISRDGEQMDGKLANQPKLKIIPVAGDEFAWVDVAATMKLVRVEKGNLSHGDFKQAGNMTGEGKKEIAVLWF